MREENVLVTQNIPSIHYGAADYFHIQEGNSESWKAEVMGASNFVDRWLAEKDNTILQLIPYVICIDPNGKILSYQRKGGGEGRLEGKHSIGIGGHINDLDRVLVEDTDDVTWDTVHAGAVREVNEELELNTAYINENLKEIGTIYVPSDDGGDEAGPDPKVGEVHLGIVYVLPVPENVGIRDGEGMIKPKYVVRPKNLAKYEKWSQFILRDLDNVRKLC